MAMDDRRKEIGTPRMEGEGAEERMEDWFKESTTTGEFEEGEVVRGRVVHVGSSEVLVDVGYKSEGAIPIEEFQRHGALPKVGDEIEVYLEAKEDAEGLIVLSKDKADKIKVWDAITRPTRRAPPSRAGWSRWSRAGSAWTWGSRRSCPAPRWICAPSRTWPR
jgi:hypothetical protein